MKQDKIKLVVFDCDGVLVDTEATYSKITHKTLNDFGIEITLENVRRKYCGVSLELLHKELQDQLGVTLQKFVDQFKKNEPAFYGHPKMIQGIDKLITQIHLPKCVASSSPKSKLTEILNTTGLIKEFGENYFSAADLGKYKPEPDVYLHAVKTMGFEPQNAIALEDSVVGVTSAKRAGLRVVGFIGGKHCVHDINLHLREAGAMEVIDKPEKFLDIIEKIGY